MQTKNAILMAAAAARDTSLLLCGPFRSAVVSQGSCGLISVISPLGVVGLWVPVFQRSTAIEEISDFSWPSGVHRIFGGPRRQALLGLPLELVALQQCLPLEITAPMRWNHSHLVLLS